MAGREVGGTYTKVTFLHAEWEHIKEYYAGIRLFPVVGRQ